MPTPIADRPTALYRCFDAGGGLLYVGVTADFEQRMTGHRNVKLWWPDVTEQRVQWFPNRSRALAAELDAIRAEAPRYNIRGTPAPADTTRRVVSREAHTTARPVRIPDEDWNEFGRLAGDRERSRVVREFIAWQIRRPDARMPKRPDAGT